MRKRKRRIQRIQASSLESAHGCYNLIVYWTAKIILYFPEVLNFDSNFHFRVEKAIKFLKEIFGKISNSVFKSEESDDVPVINKQELLALIKEIFPDLSKKAWQIEPNFLKNLNTVQKIFRLNDLEKH